MAERIRVLIVENTEDDALLIQDRLREEGFEVDCERVETAEALRTALQAGSWSVVLSDFAMPHLNGREALRIVQQSGLDIPFIVVSGSIGEETAVEVMREGAHDYVLKENLARLGPAVKRELQEARDRAEKRETEAALLDANAQVLLAQSAAGIGTWDFDLKAGQVRWSDRIYSLMGQNAGDGWESPDNFLSAIHPEDREQVREAVGKAIEQGTQLDTEFRVVWPDGSVHWLLSKAVVFRDEHGQSHRMLGLNMDLTERKEVEATLAAQNEELQQKASALYQSNKELERFAYVAAHDLQEPLRMVAAYSQLLLRALGPRVDEIPDAQTYISYMRGGIHRMEQLIQGLLSYSRVVHEDEQNLVETNAGEVLEEVRAMLRPVIVEQHATVTQGPLPTVNADRLQLFQIFQNLLSNALKYRRAEVSPQVSVTARQKGAEWIFAVRDNGIGVAPEHHERIFGIFKRLHRDEYPGIGVGLASTKRLVELHRGRIWVESEPGHGSTFFFSLPNKTAGRADPVTEIDE